jgi:diadenylate cyclase
VAANDRTDEALRLRTTLANIAPGTFLRDGLERILRGRTGGLLVLGSDKTVDSISTGGFFLDMPFTSTGLRELAKMDGAIVLDKDATRILHAAVHLMPDPSIPSDETGTRHRTADRVARQTGFPVISVSQSMQIIAVYVGGTRYVLEDAAQILSRANQALATLERYKLRLDEVSSTLSALEIEDLVTTRDVAVVAQRLEMVTRIAREIEGYVLELGARRFGGTEPRRSRGHRRGVPGAGPGRQRAPGRGRHSSGLPAACQGAPPARCGGRPAGRTLRQPAEAALGQHRRPAGRRRGGGPAGPQRP